MEGNLTLEQERQLEAFLLANPDLSTEDGGVVDDAFIGADKVPFEDKDSLRRELPPQRAPNEQTIGDFLIALHEGDLSKEQEEAVRLFMVAHQRFERESKLTAIARATEKDVVFEGKDSLMRTFPPQGLPDAHRLDDFLVARLEGDLSLQQRVALDKLMRKRCERREAVGVDVPDGRAARGCCIRGQGPLEEEGSPRDPDRW